MSIDIRHLREQWQSHRQFLLNADYNHADEELARTLHFADKTPIISAIMLELRLSKIYKEFSAEDWLGRRGHANVLGAGQTNIGFSLDDTERAAQCLRVLELAVQLFQNNRMGLFQIGETTYGGDSSKFIDSIRSAIDVIFNPFFSYVDTKLRSMESIISPTDIMGNIQTIVDNIGSLKYPDTHRLLTTTYQQLFTLSTSEKGVPWNQIGYSCRDILIQFSKEVFDSKFVSEGNELPKGDDAKEKLKWTLRNFLKKTDVGDRYRETLESIIKSNWDFVNSVGHRQESANEYDARLAVIYTYLTIWIIDDEIHRPYPHP